MDKKNLRRADLITSIVLTLIGLWIAVYSIKMMTSLIAQGVGTWYSSPGLFPLLTSIFLIVCSVTLFRRALNDGARFDFINKESVNNFLKSQVFLGSAGIIGLMVIYVYVLLKILPYFLATFLFLFLFMALFKGSNTKELTKAAVISAVATAMIAYGFGALAQIPLP